MNKDTAEEKRATVDGVVHQIRKKFKVGENSLVIGKASDIKPRERVPTGILSLDRVMEGGFPRGMWSTIYGDPQTGKTTLCNMIIAQAQAAGLVVVYVNAEGPRYRKDWASKLGVNLDDLYILDPLETTAERVLDTYIAMARNRAVDVVVVDSVSALPPREELEKDMEQSSMALIARLLSRFFRDATGINAAANICGLIVAQTRSSMSEYAKKLDSLSCGNAIKFYSQYILNTRRKVPQPGHNITRDDGFIMVVDLVKATGPAQGAIFEYEFIQNVGIDTTLDVINLAVEKGIIIKGGAGYYTIGSEVTGGEEVKVRGTAELAAAVGKYRDRLEALV